MAITLILLAACGGTTDGWTYASPAEVGEPSLPTTPEDLPEPDAEPVAEPESEAEAESETEPEAEPEAERPDTP